MAKCVIVAGLPASGKSHYIDLESPRVPGICVHDFMANSHDNSPRFVDSRHYGELVHALLEGRDCLIADIEYCDTWRRAEAEEVISRDVPGVEIECRFFENAPEKCEANADRRASRDVDSEKRKIKELSRKYQIPPGATVLPVWTPPAS